MKVDKSCEQNAVQQTSKNIKNNKTKERINSGRHMKRLWTAEINSERARSSPILLKTHDTDVMIHDLKIFQYD